MIRLFALLLVAALTACASAPPAPAANRVASISIWEGGCYTPAFCTTYTIKLTADDAYTLKAENRVRAPGETAGRIPGAFAKAVAALDANGFDAMPAAFNASTMTGEARAPCVPHLPGFRLNVVRADGTSKDLYWDQGCIIAAPQALRDGLREAINYAGLIAPPQR